MIPGDSPKSTATMMSDILGNVSSLVRNEADLARAEIAQSLGKVGASLGVMMVALVMAITGFNLVAASVVALAVWAGVPPHWAPAVVGSVLLLIALMAFLSAKASLQQIGFVPTRAARNVQRDAAVIKDSFNAQ